MTVEAKNTDIDLKKLKAAGIIKERGKDLFTIRLRVPGGRLSLPRLKKILDIAETYGGEFVHLSIRQSFELIHVPFKNVSDATEALGIAGQEVASGGARVRVPTACGGCEYNPNGLVDTQQSALEVDARLFGAETGHHKFKVGFAGCPHDCLKSATNDVGFQGAIRPELDEDICIQCGLCAEACKVSAITTGEDEKPVYAPDLCIYCGDCVKVCPSQAWKEGKRGYTVRIGGKWGRNPLIGTVFATFLPEDRVVDFLSAVLSWYREQAEGLGRIRLGDVMIRKGTDSLLGSLRENFQPYVVKKTLPPQIIDTQIGKQP
jgi:anaerobic sulfite reductase subunit C